MQCRLVATAMNCILGPGAARGPGAAKEPRKTKKIRPSKKQQFHDVGHYVRIAFWGLGQPGAQGQPGRL